VGVNGATEGIWHVAGVFESTMTVFATATGGLADVTSLAGPILVLLLVWLALLFEKAVATNVSSPGHRRYSRTIDVGLIPLGIGAVLVACAAFARLLEQAS
jgi:hypothetical protein